MSGGGAILPTERALINKRDAADHAHRHVLLDRHLAGQAHVIGGLALVDQ